jgi:hypothetical protein
MRLGAAGAVRCGDGPSGPAAATVSSRRAALAGARAGATLAAVLLAALPSAGCGGGDGTDAGADGTDGGGSATAASSGTSSGSSGTSGTGGARCPGAGDERGTGIALAFAPPTLQPMSVGPGAVRIADVTGDGLPDLAVLGGSPARVVVLPGAGDGRFAAELALPAPAPGEVPSAIEARDVDGDGVSDLVVGLRVVDVSAPGVVRIHWGGAAFPSDELALQGDGLENAAANLAVGDLDGDGRLDIVGEAAVGVFARFGADGRAFGPSALLDPNDLTALVSGLQGADLDGDGTMEAIAATTSAGAAGWKVYDVQADRVTVQTRLIPGLAIASGQARFVDVDDDDRPDLVIPDAAGVYVAYNDGRGQFDARDADVYCTVVDPLSSMTSVVVAVADLDADGATDIATVDGLDHELVVLGGIPGERGFRSAARWPAGALRPAAGYAADLNGDASSDLAVVHPPQGSTADPWELRVHLTLPR